ncbi:syntaphilin [Brachyhypopomus gauderio]|uniref:syntaphilin n=1 Tax=Brachyhypopomus gauderio TaxID=698409 RepID=UPI004042BA30
MSVSSNRRPSAGQRRRPTSTVSSRHSHGDSSISSSYSTSCKGSESNTIPRSHPTTPRRRAKYAACSENHGIRAPAPEQYLTPLQQKEVCIRHLRARLKENVERLQDRDSEIEDLRVQLTRMQEDWVEEECHRIEAQLALKEARKEIQQLQQAVDAVRSNPGGRDPEQSDGAVGGRLGLRLGASRSCGCSPAHGINRSATFTRMRSETPPGSEHDGSHFHRHAPAGRRATTLPRGEGRSHLLLEAALLSEQVPHAPLCSALSRSSTYDKLRGGETLLPVGRPGRTLGGCSCSAHAYPPHHHLFLHLPQEDAPPPPTPPPPATSAPPAASDVSDRPGFRSQACSPTITWISEEEGGGEELSFISSAPPAPDVILTEPKTFPPSSVTVSPARTSYLAEPSPQENLAEITSSATTTPSVPTPTQIQQPCPRASPLTRLRPNAVELNREDGRGGASTEEEGLEQATERSHWSRYFLVDLLAVAVPVVPAMAWLCRRSQDEGMPVYHMGSLLRGCCAVALHSLRRIGSSDAPSGTGGATTI